MIEFEAGSLGSKLIGLLFQDSQDYAPHPLEDRKKSAIEASKDFIFQASAMFKPRGKNDAKCNLFSFVPCNLCTIDEEEIGVSPPNHDIAQKTDHITGNYIPYSLRQVCGFF